MPSMNPWEGHRKKQKTPVRDREKGLLPMKKNRKQLETWSILCFSELDVTHHSLNLLERAYLTRAKKRQVSFFCI